MALAIYEGTKKDQLVDKIVDEEILRLLGLENVNDLDYDDYKTLLRERVAAARMPGSDIPTEDTEKLTEEFKRVKKETGKFKVKNNKINFDSVVAKATKKTRPVSNPTKKLMGSSVEPEGEVQQVQVQTQSDGSQDLMKLLTLEVAPSLSKIENSLENILGSLTNQQKLQNKDSEKGRVSGEKEKKKEREEKSESGIFKKLGDGAKKIASPLGDIFTSIKKFFMAILGGIVSLGLIDLFTNPEKFFRDLVNGVIDFFNGMIRGIFNIVIGPFNAFINTVNESLDSFVSGVNDALGAIDFLDVIPEIPSITIPYIPTPQIPRIPPPEPEVEPMKVSGMEGGGEVTNITNKYYELMEGGGKVTTNTGDKISSMGSDTQMVALTPGEVVMSKKAVDAYGADTLLGMNASAGGTNRPKMGMVPGYQGGGMVGGGSKPGYTPILDLISSVEAPSYDTINGGNINGLSKMTIADARQAAMNAGYGSGAMGKYQQMPQFVLSRAKAVGLDPNKDLFSPKNQDTLGKLLIDQAGYHDWKAGKMSTEKFAYHLAGTWRGLPEGPSNLTYQDQYASGNKAHTTWSNVMSVLGGGKSDVSSSSQSISAPGQSTGETAPYEFSLDDVKPMQSPTSQRPTIGTPGGGSGGSSVVVAGGGGQQQAPSSAGGGAQSSAPMFSPIDQNNPDLLVIKSIYSIV